MENFNLLLASLIGAGATYAILKLRNQNNSCGSGIENPTDVLNRWDNLNKGYYWEQFVQDISAIDDVSKYVEHLDNCLLLKHSGDHYQSLIQFNKIMTTMDKLKLNKSNYKKSYLLFITINDYINENEELSVMKRESIQIKDLMNALFNKEGWINEKDLCEGDVTYSYRNKGRQLKARKFMKIIDKPMKNLVLRTEEIQHFNSWKWYQTGTLLNDYKSTKLCRFVSVLSRFFLLNRAAYCWKMNYFLPDGSLIVSYNGANNRQSDYDLPPLPKGFSYPDIFYHAFRFIPITPTKTLVVSVMESDPKIIFLPYEAFISQGRKFGSRELILLDQHSTYIKGTEYEDCLDKNPIYEKIDSIIDEKFNK